LRIESKLQATGNPDTVLQEANLKALEDLKERINRVHLDQETHEYLKEQITELREANATVVAGLNSRTAECERLTTRVKEIGRELASCRDRLTAKSDELNAILALPKEDPQLKTRLQDSESTNASLRGQVDAANQESLHAKEELQSLQETYVQSQDKIKELEDKVRNAQASIKQASEEKKQYLAASKAGVEKARQEVVKAASAAKNEMVMRHDALVKNLEQRRAEAEIKLRTSKEELQRTKDENSNYVSSLNQLQAEINQYKDQIVQQSARIGQLEGAVPSQGGLDRKESEIQSTRNELTGLRDMIEAAQTEAAQNLGAALRTQRELESRLRRVDVLEKEKESLQQQNVNLQQRYNLLSSTMTRHLTRNDEIQKGESVDDWGLRIPSQTPNKMRPPPLPANNPSVSKESPYSDDHFNPSASQDEEILRPRRPSTLELNNGISQRFTKESGPDSGMQNPTPIAGTRTVTTRSMDASMPSSELPVPKDPLGKPQAANRRNSKNMVQQFGHRERVSSLTESTAYMLSTTTRTTHRTGETTIRFQSPPNQIVPFSAMPPIGSQSSSSLSDLDSIVGEMNSIHSLEDRQRVYKDREKTTMVQGDITCGARIGHTLAKTTISTPMKNGVPRSYESLDEAKGLPRVANRSRAAGPSSGTNTQASRSTVLKGRAQSIPLKSAIKKTSQFQDLENAGSQANVANKPFNPSSAPVQGFSQRGVTKNLSRQQSGYNCIAEGKSSKPSSMVAGRSEQPSILFKSPVKQDSRVFQNSSPMSAPRRNSRKRKPSDISGIQEPFARPAKAPRMSLVPKLSTNVIQDSQDSQKPQQYRY